MEDYTRAVRSATTFIKNKCDIRPSAGIILGTGLGGLAKRLESSVKINYSEIPHFPQSTSPSHKGCLHAGQISGVPVCIFQGRFHFYEGYSAREVAFPVRVMAEMGAKILVTSNASGGLNPEFSPGDLMIIKDHINLIPDNPLRGPNESSWGERFPDMSRAYSKSLITIAQKAARRINIPIREGVFVAVPGPSLETPAETRFLRMIGADAVAMSLVPEVIAAVHARMKVLGISVVANVNNPDDFQPILLGDVIEMAQKAETNLANLIETVLEDMPNEI